MEEGTSRDMSTEKCECLCGGVGVGRWCHRRHVEDHLSVSASLLPPVDTHTRTTLSQI